MRRINTLALGVFCAGAMSLSNDTHSRRIVTPPPKADAKERLTKAEKKRRRKNAQRARLAGHPQIIVDDPLGE